MDGLFGDWSADLVYKTEYPDGSVVEKLWARNTPYGHPTSFYADNPYVKTEFASKPNASGVLTLTGIKHFKYDKNGNLTELHEYDWVPYSSVPRSSGRPTGPPSGATPTLVTTSSYYAATVNAGDFDGGDADQYHQATAPKLLGAIASTEIRQNGQPYARTEFYYDSNFTTGNCIQTKIWDSQKGSYSNPLGAGNSISVSTSYNQGMPEIITDARGIQTRFTYGQIGSFSNLYPTQIETAFNTSLERTQTREYDYNTGLITRITDADNGISTATSYDNFGRPTLVIAAEGKPEEMRTVTEYSDEHRRVISRSDVYASGDSKRVSIQHFDQLRRLRLTRQLESSSQDATVESDGVKIQTRFKLTGGNTYQVVSNPYRAATAAQASSEATMGWTVSKFDKVGRIVSVGSFSGSSMPAPWGSNSATTGMIVTNYDMGCSQSLCAGFTTVTDQAQHKRRSMTDGLGRLKRVDEPDGNGNLGDLFSPNLPTDYSYDVFGNLIGISQSGNGSTQNRSFAYSSLQRLISATNPENGTSAYKYDDGGNVIVKSDARIQSSLRASVHYAYDALNRLTRRWYNGSALATDATHGNPALPSGVVLPDEARFYYDGQSLAGFSPGAPSFNRGYSVGHLVAATYGANTSSSGDYYAYDALGRQTLKIQQTGGVDYKISATYKPAGLSTLTYPSGHVVTYNYDAAGRLGDQGSNLAFTGNLGDGVSRTYARGITYASTGAMQEERVGTATPLYHKLAYNSRGQLTDIRVSTSGSDDSWNRGKISNSYGSTTNNGNLLLQHVYIPTNDQGTSSTFWYQTYNYDHLNRLTVTGEWNSSGQGLWGQHYDYDRFGNRTISQGTTWFINKTQYAVDRNTNRLVAPNGQSGMSYDAAGNLIGDTYTGSGSSGVETSSAVLNYDAESRLTSVQNNYGQWSQYAYDANDQRIKRTINSKETWQVYGMGGVLLAEYRAGAGAFLPSKEYGYRNGELLITVASGDDKRLVRFVDNLYFGALQRDPTSTERTTAINQLVEAAKSGQTQLRTTAAGIARALFQSTNYESTRSLDQYVTDLYYAYSHRAPDSSGLSFWIGVVNNNSGNREVALNGFEGSSEFQTLTAVLFGSATGDDQRTDQFINNLYLATTGAAATTTQLQQQRDRLNAEAALGQVFVQDEAEEMGRELFASQVTNFSISEVQFVTNLYEGFLQRGPDTLGLNFWVSEAGTNNSTKRQNVLNSFAESGPFKDLAGTLYREVFWLIPDHLGTPRMLLDRTGSLSGVKRHDYLPFGEELFATVGGRTTGLGYVGQDGVRPQFTSKERDSETGLDYFVARYYSSMQGRFTEADPVLISTVRMYDPQRINLFAHARNNPLKYIDTNGEDLILANKTAQERGRANIDARLRADERANIQIVGNKVVVKDPNAIDLSRATNAYRGLVEVISNSKITVNYYGLKPGESEKLRAPATETTGQIVSEFTYENVRARGGLTAAYEYEDGTKVYDSYVTVGDDHTVDGVNGVPVPQPETISFYHEAIGHSRFDNAGTIEFDNKVRQDAGVPQLPVRSGADHEGVVVRNTPEPLTTSSDTPTTYIIVRPLIKKPD